MNKSYSSCTFLIALALAACSHRETVADPAAVTLAAQYCARDFAPWVRIVDACNGEIRNGKRDASCAIVDQVNVILDKRLRDSGFKECTPPELRWGVKSASKSM